MSQVPRKTPTSKFSAGLTRSQSSGPLSLNLSKPSQYSSASPDLLPDQRLHAGPARDHRHEHQGSRRPDGRDHGVGVAAGARRDARPRWRTVICDHKDPPLETRRCDGQLVCPCLPCAACSLSRSGVRLNMTSDATITPKPARYRPRPTVVSLSPNATLPAHPMSGV